MTLSDKLMELRYPGWLEKRERRERCTVLSDHVRINTIHSRNKFFRVSTQQIMDEDQDLDIVMVTQSYTGTDDIHNFDCIFDSFYPGGPVAISGYIDEVFTDKILIRLPNFHCLSIPRAEILGWTTESWIRADLRDEDLQQEPYRFGTLLATLH